MMKQFIFQSNNYYDIIDMKKVSETRGVANNIPYKIIKSKSGIKLVIQNKEDIFFCSLYGNSYNEKSYKTETFINNALMLYQQGEEQQTNRI